mgnify:CR=1 FL=1
MKKIISLILSVFMILSIINVNVLAEEQKTACSEEVLTVFSEIGIL